MRPDAASICCRMVFFAQRALWCESPAPIQLRNWLLRNFFDWKGRKKGRKIDEPIPWDDWRRLEDQHIEITEL